MNKNMPAGNYTFFLTSGDDGYRLSIDGAVPFLSGILVSMDIKKFNADSSLEW
jgi:hypothetical protein